MPVILRWGFGLMLAGGILGFVYGLTSMSGAATDPGFGPAWLAVVAGISFVAGLLLVVIGLVRR